MKNFYKFMVATAALLAFAPMAYAVAVSASISLGGSTAGRGDTVTITGAHFSNGETIHVTITGHSGNIETSAITVSGNTFSGSFVVPNDATLGSDTVTATGSSHSATASLSVVIKATPTLSVTNSPVTYTGSAHAATVTGSVAGTVSNVKYDGSATVPTNAGTYAVTADFTPTDTGNYNSVVAGAAGNFVISQASSVTTVTCPATASWTGSALTPCSASVTGANLSITPTPVYANNTALGTNTASASYTFAGDTNHTGSSDTKNFSIVDDVKPVITLLGSATVNLLVGDSYTDAGATAADNYDGSITGSIVTTVTPGAVDTSAPGVFTVHYNVVDAAGNHATEVTRTVNVTAAPIVTHTITVTTGSNGAISPAGPSVSVNDGTDQGFTITPDSGYTIADVLIDGSSVGAVTNYTFTGVTTDHTIAATFSAIVPVSTATLVLSTVVVNNGGGQINMFDSQVTDTATTQTAAGSGSGTSVTIAAGTYSVAQTLPNDYHNTFSSDCSGTALVGTTIYCTIVDTYSPSYIYGGGNAPGGSVLGASTETPGIAPSTNNGVVLGTSTDTGATASTSVTTTTTTTASAPACTPFTGEMRIGGKKNDPAQVKALQTFLNAKLGLNLPVTGIFGKATRAAVIAFQEKYKDEVLASWKLNKGTGFVGPMTLKKINSLLCAQ